MIQATIGCPHKNAPFAWFIKMVPRFMVRDVAEIKEDILKASDIYGQKVRTLFLPAGNTIAMETNDLYEIITFARKVFKRLEMVP